MLGYLKQSTASQSRMVGPFVDDTDFKTLETGLTIANTDVKLSKNGAAGANKNSGGGTHRNNGMYSLTFDATDTDTVGELAVSIAVSGALVVVAKFVVVEEAIYDKIFASGAAFNDLTAAQVNAEADTALTDYDPPTKAELDAGFAALNDVSTAEVNAQCDAALADYDAPTKAELDAGLAALNDLSAAEVNAEVDSAIETYHLDHLLAANYDPASKPGVATALLNELVESDAGVSRFTANALEEAPTGGSAPTAAAIADAVWDEAAADHTAAGSFGEDVGDILADTNELQGLISSSRIAADMQAISGDSGAADKLEEGATALVTSTVNDVSATTTAFVTALTETTDDHYNGRIVTFTTGALAGQSTDITDYEGSTKTITCTALTEAPANGVAFVIS